MAMAMAMTMMTTRVVVLVAVAAALGRSAFGAPAATSEAEPLIARGLELRRQGKPAEALELFRRAHAAAPAPRTLGQMGLAEASLEAWVDADDHLSASLVEPGDPWVAKNRALLTQARAVARRHIGELIVSGPAGTTIAVDGTSVGVLPQVKPVRVAAGVITVVASGAGFKLFTKSVTIEGTRQTSLAIVLDPIDARPALALSRPVSGPTASIASTAVATEPSVPAGARGGWRTWTAAGAGAAGGGMLAWGLVWVLLDGKASCPVGTVACDTVYDTRTPGLILGAAGLGALAVAGVLYQGGGARHDGAPDVVVAAGPAGLLVRGRF